MTKSTDKEVFTCKGTVTASPMGRGHDFTAISERYLADQLNRLPLNKELTVTFYEHKAARSNQQLRYHMVLCGYIADHSGHTRAEIHDAIMRIVFGTKFIKLGAHSVQVRESMSEDARMPKHKVVELIEADLRFCSELDIVVPSAEELGYSLEK